MESLCQSEDLAYDVYDGEDDDIMLEPLPPVVILHGLFDHKGNWMNIAKEIADKTVRKVYVLDMRDHGESPKTSSMNHENNVSDLEKFLKILNKPSVLIGHSVGGTASIDLAFRQPNLVKELILIDISPLRYPENEELRGLNVSYNMKRMLLNLPTDNRLFDAKSLLKDEINNSMKVSSLAKIVYSNLVESEGRWKWKVNLEPLDKMGKLQLMRKVYPLKGTFEGRCLLIHSDTSKYVIPKYDYNVLRIVFPEIKFLCFEQCSHWIHMDKPREITLSIVQHLNNNGDFDK